MEAVKSSINVIFSGARQYSVPVYQRKYSWEMEQCRRLWDDLVRMQKTGRPGHFVGSFVNIEETQRPDGLQQYMIIDGQQRMATLTLLLVALRDYLADHPEAGSIDPEEITAGCLKNPALDGQEQYKILLTQADSEVLLRLIEQRPPQRGAANRLLAAYRFFRERIESKELTCEEVFDAVGRLQIVNITLDRQDDDPQLIFESLNSTGLDLSQSDLIRNYVLMGLEAREQNQIYEDIWLKIENLFDYERQTQLMDRFFRDYLTMRMGRIPKVEKVYEAFKQEHPMRSEDPFALCGSLLSYARYYTDLYYCRSEDGVWNNHFADIKALQMEVSYPFLLKVYADYRQGRLQPAEFEEILRLCESYVFRRAICEVPTNSLNKTFATLKNEIDEREYLVSIKAFFLTRETYKEFPGDEQFAEAFITKDISNMRVRGYILDKLENTGRKKPVDINSLTIEHIMPTNANLSLEWRRMLGSEWRRVQRTWLNTIGNLTLCAYSPDMNERPFSEKLRMAGGLHKSGLRLNDSLEGVETWNEKEIAARGRALAERALQIWQAPQLDEQLLERYAPQARKEQYNIESYRFNAFTRILFEHLDKRIRNISRDVKRECKKQGVSYKYDTTFVEVSVQKARLRLLVNLLFDEVEDPMGLAKDTGGKIRGVLGEVEIGFESLEQMGPVMDILMQAYNKQAEI